MLRSLFGLVFALIFTTSAAAETSIPFRGAAEKLVYVGESQFPGRAGPQSLCLRVTDQHFFYIPVQRQVTDYVFSDTHCTTGDVWPIAANQVKMFKLSGLLPTDIADVPALSIYWSVHSKGGLLLALFAVFAIPILLRRRMALVARRRVQKSSDPIFYDVLLTLLFHTAGRDGIIDQPELQAIMRIYKELTGSRVTPKMTAEKFALSLKDDAMLHLAKPYRGAEAELLLDAAILVATFRGSISREKLHLLKRLNSVLERDPSWFSETIDAALRPPAALDTQSA